MSIVVDQLQRRPGETVSGAILRVASHELTHFIQDKNAADYKALKNFCFNHILQAHTQEEINRQRAAIIESNENADKELSPEAAIDEMVANACEQMLLNSDILSELYKQNASLAQKVQIKVSEFFAKLRQNIGNGARSKEAAWMSDAIDELQEKWEAALRVAAENQIKLNSAEGTKNTATEGGDVRYSPVLDEDATVIDLSEENELKDRIGDLKGAKKYKVIRDYIIEKLGRNITFSDGQSAIIDNSDANHIAHDSADKKTAEISAVENLIQSAVAYAYDDNVEHNKFDYFKYYEAAVKFGEESFHVYFNLGRGKYDGKFHFYDLTNKIRDTARRINGVGRPRGFLPENGISKDIVSNPSEKSNPSDEKNSAVLPASALDTDAEYLKQSQKKYGDIESAAKKHFGTTDNFRIAGYVLADGTMLDFSGAHWLIGNDTDAAYVAEWREKNDIRQVDHEDIFEAFDGNNFPSDSRKEFINRGNIRISPEAPGINIASVPTAQQYSVIKELVRDNPYDTEGFYVDIEDKQKHIGKLTYTGKVNADLVVNDIKHFYETGEIREQSIVNQFHGQFSTPLGEDALDIGDAEQLTDETGNRKSVALSLNALDVDLSKLTDEDILNSLSSDGKLTKKGKLLMIDIDTQKEGRTCVCTRRERS